MQILENAIIKIAITQINNGTTTNDFITRKISPTQKDLKIKKEIGIYEKAKLV